MARDPSGGSGVNGAGMDLKALSDGGLDALRRDVQIEKERRENLAAIPDQVAALAKVYRDGGGDEERLQEALTAEEREALMRA